MAEAQFTPYLPPGGIVDAAFSGASQMQSLMAHGQQMRESAEQAQRAKEIYEVGRPVMEAKAQADLAVAQGTLYNARQVQQLRAQFGQASKDAGAEYQKAMQLPTYEQQANALSDVAQKYSYFELFPEGKAFMDTIQNKGLQQTHYGILDTQNRAALAREQQRFEDETALTITKGDEARKTNAAYGKGESKNEKDMRLVQSLRDQGRTDDANALVNGLKGGRGGKPSADIQLVDRIAEETRNPNGDPEVLALLKARLRKSAQWAPHLAEFEANQNEVEKATAEGNIPRADAFEARNRALAFKAELPDTYPTRDKPEEKKTTILEDVLGGVKKIKAAFSSDPIPAPSPPAAPANTKTVKIEGKDYPVYTDAKGNRAYHKDGKYYPIP